MSNKFLKQVAQIYKINYYINKKEYLFIFVRNFDKDLLGYLIAKFCKC